MQPGQVEVVSSTTEIVGLPNWSSVSILVSAKTTVRQEDNDAAQATLDALVNGYCRVHVERVAQSLNMSFGLPDAPASEPAQPQWTVTPADNVEVTFSVTERISLPSLEKGQNSAVNILASAKTLAQAGAEVAALEWASASVKRQLASKRDQVRAQPRGWTA